MKSESKMSKLIKTNLICFWKNKYIWLLFVVLVFMTFVEHFSVDTPETEQVQIYNHLCLYVILLQFIHFLNIDVSGIRTKMVIGYGVRYVKAIELFISISMGEFISLVYFIFYELYRGDFSDFGEKIIILSICVCYISIMTFYFSDGFRLKGPDYIVPFILLSIATGFATIFLEDNWIVALLLCPMKLLEMENLRLNKMGIYLLAIIILAIGSYCVSCVNLKSRYEG